MAETSGRVSGKGYDGRGLIRKMIAKSGLTVYANPMHLVRQAAGWIWLDGRRDEWWEDGRAGVGNEGNAGNGMNWGGG